MDKAAGANHSYCCRCTAEMRRTLDVTHNIPNTHYYVWARNSGDYVIEATSAEEAKTKYKNLSRKERLPLKIRDHLPKTANKQQHSNYCIKDEPKKYPE